jgi:dolichyl-phosphate beta-glucosyltransferase
MKPVDLSIIIPAYHEASRIEQSLLMLANYLKQRDYGRIEVLIMAQSNDDTGAAAKHEAKYFDEFRVVNLGQRAGKGGAVRAGIFEAKGRYKMFMDADMATPLHHLDDVAKIMAEEGKVGIAVRNIISTHKGLRKILSEVGNILTQVLIAPGIKDTQCGFKVFESNAADEIFSRQTILGWAFDMELLLIARKLGYRIDTFEANDWSDPKSSGLVGESALKASVTMFKDMIKIRIQSMLGKYREKSFSYTSPK